MDSVQDILILIFIIFSIVSSLLKKKTADDKKKKPARPNAKKPLFDLEELLGLQTSPAPQKQKQNISEVDAYFLRSENDEKYEATYQEPREKSYSEKRAEKIKELESLKEKEAKIQKTAKIISRPSKSNDFKKRLMKASSLREYVIMNEILGKPISLRE